MSTDTLSKWGDTAKQYVRLTDHAVVLHIDEDEIIIPEGDVTARKALWADIHWIVCRLLETGAETVSRNYERTSDLLLAGERLVALCRAVVEHKDHVARSITLARCLDAYDVAKRHARAPTVYERIRGAEPEPQQPALELGTEDKGWMKAPSMPEPETEALYQVLVHWKRRLKAIEEELAVVKAKHEGGDPNAPCPEDLAMAYKRAYKAQDVVSYLEAAIHEQLGEHLATVTDDDSGDFPSEIRFQIQTRFLTSRSAEGTADGPAPAPPADPAPNP